jgi:hypothetical protein
MAVTVLMEILPEIRRNRELNPLPRRPQEAALQYRFHLGNIEFARDMAERRIEHTTVAVTPLPDDWHDDTVDPGTVGTVERRRRQHFVRWIDVHVILFGTIRKWNDALHDRIVGLFHVDPIVDHGAGMRDPLAADDELVLGR